MASGWQGAPELTMIAASQQVGQGARNFGDYK